MKRLMDPQPPADARIEPTLIFDRHWWADSPAWNPWFEGDEGRYQLPKVIVSPEEMPEAQAVFAEGRWWWWIEGECRGAAELDIRRAPISGRVSANTPRCSVVTTPS